MNLRPSGYEPDELPDCSTPQLEPRIIGNASLRSKLRAVDCRQHMIGPALQPVIRPVHRPGQAIPGRHEGSGCVRPPASVRSERPQQISPDQVVTQLEPHHELLFGAGTLYGRRERAPVALPRGGKRPARARRTRPRPSSTGQSARRTETAGRTPVSRCAGPCGTRYRARTASTCRPRALRRSLHRGPLCA